MSTPAGARNDTLGLYVHVPFCERICPYCDFAVERAPTLPREREERYVAALLCELDMRAGAFAGLTLETLYLGGGTPSLLRPELVARVLAAAVDRFGSRPRETTLEINPSTLERERLAGFREAGIDRLSVGVQSFDDTVLRRLGRAHRADESRRTLAATREAGFDNVSVDLIFAAPESSLEQLAGDLAELAGFQPEHVSAYELTVEAGTPFALAAERSQLACPDEEVAVAMSELIESELSSQGLERYEISSYARPGCRSRHNSRYWEREPVLGLGVGAWSNAPASDAFPHGLREANSRSLAAYLAALEAGGTAVCEREPTSPATARAEAVFLGLRRTQGLDLARFEAEFGAPLSAFYAEEIQTLSHDGLIVASEGGFLRLSARGRLFADSVASRFV
jgi:oxygen-independent coproporphyrinogen-3 oxidase